jgi:hypothetical protein
VSTPSFCLTRIIKGRPFWGRFSELATLVGPQTLRENRLGRHHALGHCAERALKWTENERPTPIMGRRRFERGGGSCRS